MDWKDLKVGDRIFRVEIVMLETKDVVRVVEYAVTLLGKRFFEFSPVGYHGLVRHNFESWGGMIKEFGWTPGEATKIRLKLLEKQLEDAEQRFKRQKNEILAQQKLVKKFRAARRVRK